MPLEILQSQVAYQMESSGLIKMSLAVVEDRRLVTSASMNRCIATVRVACLSKKGVGVCVDLV